MLYVNLPCLLPSTWFIRFYSRLENWYMKTRTFIKFSLCSKFCFNDRVKHGLPNYKELPNLVISLSIFNDVLVFLYVIASTFRIWYIRFGKPFITLQFSSLWFIMFLALNIWLFMLQKREKRKTARNCELTERLNKMDRFVWLLWCKRKLSYSTRNRQVWYLNRVSSVCLASLHTWI